MPSRNGTFWVESVEVVRSLEQAVVGRIAEADLWGSCKSVVVGRACGTLGFWGPLRSA